MLDLKQPADKQALLNLVDQADILVENYRPGVLDRLDLGWDVLHARNPRLILASISGFGQTGPYSSRGGFDLITQAMPGLMSTNGPEDGPPFRLPIAISDVTAGMFLAFGVMAAVEARHRTEARPTRGDFVAGSSNFARGVRVRALLRHRHAPSTDRPAASRQLALSVLRDRGRLHHTGRVAAEILRRSVQPGRRAGACWAIRASQQHNANRVANNAVLVEALAEKIRMKPSSYWLAELERLGIPAGPVLHYDEVYTDPQILAREMVVETNHPVTGPFRTMGVTVKLSGTPGAVRAPAPRLGEHTGEILSQRKAAE